MNAKNISFLLRVLELIEAESLPELRFRSVGEKHEVRFRTGLPTRIYFEAEGDTHDEALTKLRLKIRQHENDCQCDLIMLDGLVDDPEKE